MKIWSALLPTVVLMSAGTAQAQSAPFTVTIGGDVYFEAGFVSQKRDANLRSTEFANRIRLVVDAKAKADNGLEYGSRLRLRTLSGDRTVDVDNAYLYASGSWGTLNAGLVAGPSDDLYIVMQTPLFWRVSVLTNQPVGYTGGSASRSPDAGADVPYFKAGFDWPTFGPLEGNATKLVYYSPRFAGFQAALSYGPRSDSGNTDIDRRKAVPGGGLTAPSYQDVAEAGVNYSDTLGGVTVQGFATYIRGKATDSGSQRYRDLNGWHIGGQIGIGAVAIGAGYLDTGRSGIERGVAAGQERTRMVTVGAQYTTGPWILGTQFQRGQDAGDLTVPGRRRLDMATVGALYALAPGLRVGGEYSRFTADSDVAGRDDRGSVVLLHGILTF